MSVKLSNRLRAWAEKDGRGYPDWAMRYGPIVRRLGPRLKPDTMVLELGANENGFSRFSDVRTVVLDIEYEHVRACRDSQDVLPVVGDITSLPFKDDCTDACISVDTFEHLSESMRRGAVIEMGRVLKANGILLAAFPADEASAAAETIVRNRYRDVTGGTLRWLEEHLEVGLPDPDSVCDDIRNALGTSHRIIRSKNATLWIWKWVWLVLICGWPGRGNAVFQVLLRLGTPVISRMHFGTCYRTLIWAEPRQRSDD